MRLYGLSKMIRILKKFLNLIGQYAHLKKEYNQTKVSRRLKNEIIIFNSIKSDELVFGIEFLLLLMLSKKGAKCIGIIDDGVFNHHDFIQKSNNFDYINPQNKIIYIIRRILLVRLLRYVSKNIEIVYVSEIKKINFLENDKSLIKDLCDKHAQSSTKRYFQAAFFDRNDINHKNYYDLSYKNSELSLKIAYYALERGATKFCTSHGIYSCWGPAYDYLAYKNFRNIYIYGVNTYKSGELFISKEKLQLQSKCKFLQERIKEELTHEKNLKIIEYLNARVNKTTKDNRVYYNFDLRKLMLDKSKRNIFLFPNVIWDGDIPEKDTLFNGLVNWILETIEFANNNKDLNLYIRFHPAETSWYEGVVKLEDIILPMVKDKLGNNIYFIKSGDNIDLYNLIPEIDLLVIYDGILAIESAFLKKPFLLASTGRFSVDNFGSIPKNKEEYFDALINYDPNQTELDIIFNNGLKLAYNYIFEISVTFPSISNDFSDFGVDLYKCNSSNIDLDNNIKLINMLELS